LIQLLPIPDDVATVIALVSHHYHNGVAVYLLQAAHNSATETVRSVILDRIYLGNTPPQLIEDLPCFVRAAVVNNDNLVRDVMQPQLYVEMLDGGRNAVLFIARRNHHRELR
jgi:hypothetical protein